MVTTHRMKRKGGGMGRDYNNSSRPSIGFRYQLMVSDITHGLKGLNSRYAVVESSAGL